MNEGERQSRIEEPRFARINRLGSSPAHNGPRSGGGSGRSEKSTYRRSFSRSIKIISIMNAYKRSRLMLGHHRRRRRRESAIPLPPYVRVRARYKPLLRFFHSPSPCPFFFPAVRANTYIYASTCHSTMNSTIKPRRGGTTFSLRIFSSFLDAALPFPREGKKLRPPSRKNHRIQHHR